MALPANCSGFRIPQQRDYQNTFNFLVWNQFPVIMDNAIRHFIMLPQVGVYRHINPNIKDFKRAILQSTGRDFFLSGIGSLIDYETFGHQLRRPTPQLQGTGCNGNSLCIEPTCFGFTEGVQESANQVRDICWSLSMPCLKDMEYSDADFADKMREYFTAFFKQPAAVVEAYQRTRLIKEAIKVVATDKNFRFTGPVIGGANGIPLPFWINPTDPTAFPLLSSIGANVGGFNIAAFRKYLAPRLFSGAYSNEMEDVQSYGLLTDKETAIAQAASVNDTLMDQEIIRRMAARGMSNSDAISDMLGNFNPDGLFPTFDVDLDGYLVPITQEILQAATIAGYIQDTNPAHSLAPYRGILFVPTNWMFDLVSPPKDNYSDLGLGPALNFVQNTPGVFPIMSSSMFSRNQVGQNGIVVIGDTVGADGMIGKSVRGLVPRQKNIPEAVRTEVLLTYSSTSCNNTPSGQLPNVGPAITPQARADGFLLKSTIYISTDVRGSARPVLVLFADDTPRAATPIKVCDVVEVDIYPEGDLFVQACCPGNMNWAALTFTGDVSDRYAEGDLAIWRSGGQAQSLLVEVTAVDGALVTITAQDDEDIIVCCTGSPDDYGVRGTLTVYSDAVTNETSEIMKSLFTDGTPDTLTFELFDPVAPWLNNAAATITLVGGQEILVEASPASTDGGVFVTVHTAAGETCDLADLTCNVLQGAVLTFT